MTVLFEPKTLSDKPAKAQHMTYSFWDHCALQREQMQIEDFDIAATAIEATTHPPLWDTLYDKIAKRLGARVFMLQEYDVEAHTTTVFYASSLMRTGEADGF